MLGQRTGITCIRHTLCVINAFVWLVGCGILMGGLWLRLSYGGYASLLQRYAAVSADSLCLAAGVITFVLAFCGCCGAWFQSRCMLVTYFSLVLAVFALELSAGCVLFAYRSEVGGTLATELRAGLKAAGNLTEGDPVVVTWHRLHKAFECCGVAGPTDWHNSPAWPGKPWVPHSCCRGRKSLNPECGRGRNSSDRRAARRVHQTGCYDAVRLWFARRLHLIGLAALVVAFLQLFGLIASMLLFCTLGEKRKSRTYKSYATDTT